MRVAIFAMSSSSGRPASRFLLTRAAPLDLAPFDASTSSDTPLSSLRAVHWDTPRVTRTEQAFRFRVWFRVFPLGVVGVAVARTSERRCSRDMGVLLCVRLYNRFL